MSEEDPSAADPVGIHQALVQWERSDAPVPPDFEGVRRMIHRRQSPLEMPSWSFAHSVGLLGPLLRAQLQVVPWLITPLALASGALSLMAARLGGAALGTAAADTAFTSVILLGVVLSISAALSTAGPDQVSLSTPIGPCEVILARVTAVLALDAAASALASITATVCGYTSTTGHLVLSWLVPMMLVAGLVTLTAIWLTPGAGVAFGIVAVPLVAPASHMVGAMPLGILWRLLGSVGIVVTGIAILSAAVASANAAAQHKLQTA